MEEGKNIKEPTFPLQGAEGVKQIYFLGIGERHHPEAVGRPAQHRAKRRCDPHDDVRQRAVVAWADGAGHGIAA